MEFEYKDAYTSNVSNLNLLDREILPSASKKKKHDDHVPQCFFFFFISFGWPLNIHRSQNFVKSLNTSLLIRYSMTFFFRF